MSEPYPRVFHGANRPDLASLPVARKKQRRLASAASGSCRRSSSASGRRHPSAPSSPLLAPPPPPLCRLASPSALQHQHPLGDLDLHPRLQLGRLYLVFLLGTCEFSPPSLSPILPRVCTPLSWLLALAEIVGFKVVISKIQFLFTRFISPPDIFVLGKPPILRFNFGLPFCSR